jgi:arsenite methyltransferase
MTSTMTLNETTAQRVQATYTTPDVAATRIAVFRAVEPRSGERIADLSCGPDFMTRELALPVGPRMVVFMH